MVNKYGWVDTGSSFLPSEVNCAFLYAQLESLDVIQNRRKAIWNQYHEGLKVLAERGFFSLPDMPDYATNNAHMFYLVCRNLDERTGLIKYLKEHDVLSVFHYLSLHKSEFYTSHNTDIPNLPLCDMYADCLVRLPMFYELTLEQIDEIVRLIFSFFQEQ